MGRRLRRKGIAQKYGWRGGTITLTDTGRIAAGSQQTTGMSVSALLSKTIAFPQIAGQAVGAQVALTATVQENRCQEMTDQRVSKSVKGGKSPFDTF